MGRYHRTFTFDDVFPGQTSLRLRPANNNTHVSRVHLVTARQRVDQHSLAAPVDLGGHHVTGPPAERRRVMSATEGGVMVHSNNLDYY